MLRYRYNNQPVAGGERDLFIAADGTMALKTGLISADIAAETITYRLREVYIATAMPIAGDFTMDFQT